MARKQARPPATKDVTLKPLQSTCRACGSRMRMARHSHRTVTTLHGVTHLTDAGCIAAATPPVRASSRRRDRRKKVDGQCRMENSGWM